MKFHGLKTHKIIFIYQKIGIIVWTAVIAFFATLGLLNNEESSNALFFSSNRNVWALFIVWFIFALDCGTLKRLGDFLSHKLWMPLGKLSYSIYMTHTLVQMALIVSQKQPTNFDVFRMVKQIITNNEIWKFITFNFSQEFFFSKKNLEKY
jgi:peptidoglycan/LPS O-acetylase OafA/YrhL